LLGYEVKKKENGTSFTIHSPLGRKVIFLGDLVDRGPNTPDTLQLVMDMVESDQAYCVTGNHDMKLLKKLKGADVKLSHGLHKSLEQLENKDPAFIERIIHFLSHLTYHYVLDEGNLVVAHAGMKEEFQGRSSGKVRAFALFGCTKTKLDEEGFPIREAWADDYHGKALVVYGHTIVPEPLWINRSVNIDTGCVFGGKLSALRYPEMEIVSVPALFKYSEPSRPFGSAFT
jgi:protein phosphatase